MITDITAAQCQIAELDPTSVGPSILLIGGITMASALITSAIVYRNSEPPIAVGVAPLGDGAALALVGRF